MNHCSYRKYRKTTGKNVVIQTLETRRGIGKHNLKQKEYEIIEQEVDYLSSIRHINIVQFLGWTKFKGEKVIVIEKMYTNLQSGKIYFNV